VVILLPSSTIQKEMARGIINYDFEDMEAIKGKKSSKHQIYSGLFGKMK